MGFLMKMNRNRVVRGIARNCTPFLVTGYGPQSSYTPGQIDRAMEETGCNSDFSDYAYVMFGSEEDFPNDRDHSYDEIHSEIGDIFFNGNGDFGAEDFISVSNSSDTISDGDGCGGDGD